MHTKLLRGLCNDSQLWQFLNDEEDALAHLLCQQSQLDEVLVLVPVADDEAVAVHVGCEDGMQLRLRASFQSEVVALAVTDNLLNDRSHLVYLDREDDEMLALVLVLLCGFAEALVGLLNTVVEDVGETK